MSNIESPKLEVTAETVRQNAPMAIAMMKKLIKTGCSKSHALDIISAGIGIKDYQTLNGLLKKDYYQMRTKIGGDRDNPIYSEISLGFFESYGFATDAFSEMAENINIEKEWELIKNGKPHGTFRKSSPHNKDWNGYTLTVEITGRNESDLVDGLNRVSDSVEKGNYTGFDGGTERSYTFERYGEEEQLNIFTNTPNYAIVDNNGWIEKSVFNLDDEFSDAGNNGASIVNWDGDLMCLESIDLDDEDLAYDDEAYALDEDGKVYFSGEWEDVKENIKESEVKTHLYKLIESKS